MTPRLPRLRSMRARLTLMLGSISVIVFAVAGALMHHTLERELSQQEASAIDAKLELVRHFIAEVSSPADFPALRQRLYDVSVHSGNIRIWIVARDGDLVFGGPQKPVVLDTMDGRATIRHEDGVAMSGRQVPLTEAGPLEGAQLTVAVDTRPRTRLMSAHDSSLLLVSSLGVVLTIVFSSFAAFRGLAPVGKLSAEASRITPETLGVRLPVEDIDRELRSLAVAFNRVLDRLEAAYKHMESFNADVAHELRTPLAILISGTQLALSAERPAAELRETLSSNLEELEQMNALISDMLFLARADTGEIAEDTGRVSLAGEATNVAEYVDPVAEIRRVALRIEGDASVNGNASLLRRALLNLVVNAINYSTEAGTVTIDITPIPDGHARVAVRNEGQPIAATELPRIFDRFYRGDRARAARGESHGLGLAIVRAIARMHGGTTFASSRGGVTEVGFEI